VCCLGRARGRPRGGLQPEVVEEDVLVLDAEAVEQVEAGAEHEGRAAGTVLTNGLDATYGKYL